MRGLGRVPRRLWLSLKQLLELVSTELQDTNDVLSPLKAMFRAKISNRGGVKFILKEISNSFQQQEDDAYGADESRANCYNQTIDPLEVYKLIQFELTSGS